MVKGQEARSTQRKDGNSFKEIKHPSDRLTLTRILSSEKCEDTDWAELTRDMGRGGGFNIPSGSV